FKDDGDNAFIDLDSRYLRRRFWVCWFNMVYPRFRVDTAYPFHGYGISMF
ncbi:hypothetical protein Tco_1259912, partial [Tanacetum coccineum]